MPGKVKEDDALGRLVWPTGSGAVEQSHNTIISHGVTGGLLVGEITAVTVQLAGKIKK